MALLIPTIAVKVAMTVYVRKQFIIDWNNRVEKTEAFMKHLKSQMEKCGGCPRAAKCKKQHKPKYIS